MASAKITTVTMSYVHCPECDTELARNQNLSYVIGGFPELFNSIKCNGCQRRWRLGVLSTGIEINEVMAPLFELTFGIGPVRNGFSSIEEGFNA